MNLRVYLRLLRPVHSLVWTVFYSWCLAGVGTVFLHQSHATETWIRWLVLPPLLWGGCLAGAVNAAMFRPFFPLLPNALNKVRRATVVATILSAIAIGGLASWRTGTPLFGAWGLAVAFVTVALPFPRANLFSAVLVLPVVLLVAVGGAAAGFVSAHPAVVFALGIGTAALVVRAAFSPRRVRQYAFIPYNSAGPTFFLFFNFNASRRYGAEMQRWRAQAHPARLAVARDWKRGSDTTWSWMRAVWHAMPGRWRYPWSHVGLALVLAMQGMLIPAIGFFVAKFGTHEFCELLARTVAWNPFAGAHGTLEGLVGMSMAPQGIFVGVFPLFSPPINAVLPIARRRLANVAVGLVMVEIAIAIASFGLVYLLMALGAHAALHHSLASFDGRGLLVLLIALVPVLLVSGAGRIFRHSFARLLFGIFAGCVALALALTRTWYQDYLLSYAGVLAWLVIVGLSFALLQFALRRYYHGCDLLDDIRAANPLAMQPA